MTAKALAATLAIAWLASLMDATMAAEPVRGGVPLTLAPRIQPAVESELTPEQRALLEPLARERGSVPNLYYTLVRFPKMFTPRYDLGHYIKVDSSLSARDRELLICRTAWLTSAEYEWAAHTRSALTAGLTHEDLRRIALGPTAAGWSPQDRAVLRAVDELVDEIFISDVTWSELAARLDQTQLMDLVMTVGVYQSLATLLRSCGIALEPNAITFASVRESDWPAPAPARPSIKPATPIRLKTPRIAPATEADWSKLDRKLLASVGGERNSVPGLYNTLIRQPKLFPLWLEWSHYIYYHSSLAAHQRELLILRIAYLCGGEYEWSAHLRMARQGGLSEADAQRVGQEPLDDRWNAADRAMLRAVDELHRDAIVSNDTWRQLADRFSDQQLVDLVLTVGSYKMLAMALNSFGTQLDPGMTGFSPRGK